MDVNLTFERVLADESNDSLLLIERLPSMEHFEEVDDILEGYVLVWGCAAKSVETSQLTLEPCQVAIEGKKQASTVIWDATEALLVVLFKDLFDALFLDYTSSIRVKSIEQSLYILWIDLAANMHLDKLDEIHSCDLIRTVLLW